MACRFSFAAWLRTPVQGSTPLRTWSSQENASGSDFTSQWFIGGVRSSGDLRAGTEYATVGADHRGLEQAGLGIRVAGSQLLGRGAIGDIDDQQTAAGLLRRIQHRAGLDQLRGLGLKIGQMPRPGRSAEIEPP